MLAPVAAGRQMESLTMDREVRAGRATMHLRDALIPSVCFHPHNPHPVFDHPLPLPRARDMRYAELVYYGYWYSPERLALQSLVEESQKNLRGTVRVKLYKGNIMVAGRMSPV